jgi:hypothetical protein
MAKLLNRTLTRSLRTPFTITPSQHRTDLRLQNV